GSAGVDLALAESVSIQDTQVHVVPSTVSGPIGYGLSALLIGRSSSSKQGIFVLPGCIDADFTGVISIMIQCFLPPVHLPAGSKIAQLIPFKSAVPQVIDVARGNRGFGSTGPPQVAFCQTITQARPTQQVTITGPNDIKLTNVLMMLDTGADVTVV
ncbi:POK9 protein, partial [Scytalopus superciliaris]|nr:POK9 protein [Scytalopus superciliaris]